MQFSVILLLITIFNGVKMSANNGIFHKSNRLLLKYLHGYKIGQDSELKNPVFIVSPILFVLSRKHNDDTRIEKVDQETSALSANIMPSDNNYDIDENFRQALDRGSVKELRQVNRNESFEPGNDTGNNTKETVVTKENTANKDNKNFTYDTATEVNGLYPNATYNNDEINSLTITGKAPDKILYPPSTDEQWKNFTLSTNVTIKENSTVAASDSLNITEYPSLIEADSSIKGVYTEALYNNAAIDQLSITTNSYTNRSPPPPQDDRWSFSSLRKMLPASSNEFRPLAGLYYDGFLHTPILKTPGFVPYNHRYLY